MRRAAIWIASFALHAVAIGLGVSMAYGLAQERGVPPVVRILASDPAVPAVPSRPPREPMRVETAPPAPTAVPEPPLETTPEIFEDAETPPETQHHVADSEWWRIVDPHARVVPEEQPVAPEAEATEPSEEPDPDKATSAEAPPAPLAAYVPAREAADNPPPEYPARARRLGQEGTVVVSVSVDAQGRVLDAEVIRSCPYGLLNREALRAVRGWRFEPSMRDGVAVPGRTEVEVVFELTSGR